MVAAVNRPTDTKMKERDVNNKLQLYGIYSAFANGKVPSNKQIDVAMNSAIASRGFGTPSKRLSPEGQELVGETKVAMEQAKTLLLTKNDGNLLQDFIWHCEQLGTVANNTSTPNAPLDKSTMQQDGNQAMEGFRTLGTLLITNGEFRKLLNDASVLLRDMAGDAAQNSANYVRPSEDARNQIDHPAEANTWHEKPDLSRQNMKNQMKSTAKANTGIGGRDDMRSMANDAAGDATQSAHPSGSRDPADAANLAARDQQQGTSSGVDAQTGASSGLSSAQNKLSERIPQENKDRARDTMNKTRGYLDNKMPKERREQIIYRMKKMVSEIQGHQDYQQAIDTLLTLAERYTGHTKNVTQQSVGTVKQAHGNDHLSMAEADLKTLLERFANYTSFDDLIASVNEMYRDADRDPELKGWFRRLNTFTRRCLKENGYIMQDSSTQEYNQIYDKGQFLLRDRYKDHTNHLFDEIKFITDQFGADPQSKAFGDSMDRLFKHLGNDENGKPAFKPHLVKDLTEVIIPTAFQRVQYVPIPRIEYSDPQFDAIVENLVIESDNLMPNLLELGNDNYMRYGRSGNSSAFSHAVMVSASGIQCDLRDVSYYIKRKQGFPSITDLGVADIFLGGQGFSFKIKMATADAKDRRNFFKVEKLDVTIRNLDVKLKQSKHKLLFNLFKPLLFKIVTPVITKVVEVQLRKAIHDLDSKLYSVHLEAQRAIEQAKQNPDPDNVKNIYQQYATAAQSKLMKGKEKSQAAAQDKSVNVAMTQHDSMFKNIKLPGGISSKATEYKDLAIKGDKWESPVFAIGSASATTNLPKASQVTRKPHDTRSAGIRGGNHPGSAAGQTDMSNSGYGSGGSGGYGSSTAGTSSGAGYGTGVGSSTGAGYANDSNTGAGYGSTTGAVASGAGYGSSTSGTTSGAGYGNSTSGMTSGAGYGNSTSGMTSGSGYGSSTTGATTGAGYGSSNTGLGSTTDYSNTGATDANYGTSSSQAYTSQPTAQGADTTGFKNDIDSAFAAHPTSTSGY